MKDILQVKQYNNKIALKKYNEAVERWKNQESRFGYPCKSMYFFYKFDKTTGLESDLRKKGYIIFNETSSHFYMNKQKALEMLETMED